MYSFTKEQIKSIQSKALNCLGQPMKYKQLCEIVSGSENRCFEKGVYDDEELFRYGIRRQKDHSRRRRRAHARKTHA